MIWPGGIFVRVAKWDHIRSGDGLLCETPFQQAAVVVARWNIWASPTICIKCQMVHDLFDLGAGVA